MGSPNFMTPVPPKSQEVVLNWFGIIMHMNAQLHATPPFMCMCVYTGTVDEMRVLIRAHLGIMQGTSLQASTS